jgi:hypothetical protein
MAPSLLTFYSPLIGLSRMWSMDEMPGLKAGFGTL